MPPKFDGAQGQLLGYERFSGEAKITYINSTSQHHARLGVLSWFTKGVVWRICFNSARPVRFQSGMRLPSYVMRQFFAIVAVASMILN